MRRRRYKSSESIESMFSYQFSQMITLARQTQSTVLEHDNQSIDGDGAVRLVQLTSTRTTPSGSRRWRRVFSDTEKDGFDSFNRENESYVSFRRYRHFPGEDDTISYTTNGGDSDASIDGNLENENLQYHLWRRLRCLISPSVFLRYESGVVASRSSRNKNLQSPHMLIASRSVSFLGSKHDNFPQSARPNLFQQLITTNFDRYKPASNSLQKLKLRNENKNVQTETTPTKNLKYTLS
ncbi:uncharacterized protein Fot_03109 [Forsythia ovata]|uniref:Uncharacterized protein n=1 Tax=Forsythia ovata TaxID=205694 RepID=A0ABD1X9L9_9LAMI